MASGSPSYALFGAVTLACVAGAVSAVGAITTAEQFPGEGRISGLALGATTATAIFGGLTPFVAQVLTERTGWALVPGAMIAVVAVLVLPISDNSAGNGADEISREARRNLARPQRRRLRSCRRRR